MSKAILVIDMPDGCRECPLCGEDHMTYRDYCRITDQYIWTLDKPDWCPLKLMPKKMEGNDSIYYQWGDYEDGWNHCIDSILGKSKNDG